MPVRSLWAAFSFLTRLAPARIFTGEELAASVRWYPLAGLSLGLLACVPALLRIAGEHPSIQAFLYLFILFGLTRGLHWDGLADCLDAWGSGARGERFQAVLKDSRIGAFGVLGVSGLLLLQWAAATALLEGGIRAAWPVLVLAPALGRTAMQALPVCLPPHQVSSLGRIIAPGCTAGRLAVWSILLLGLLGYCTGLSGLAWAAVLTGAALAGLIRLARREGGFNGDFLGSACLLAESAVLLAPLL